MTAAPASMAEILGDLGAEQDRLEQLLAPLDAATWAAASAAPGWSLADVVLHLAQSEEMVVATLAVGAQRQGAGLERPGDASTDGMMDALVRAERAEGPVVFERWRRARRQALCALEQADPAITFSWAAAPLRPPTLATTRLAEHWAHGLDITGPLGIEFPDTPRLRHVAWLAHRSLPYAFSLAGSEPQAVHCAVTGPEGERWEYGPPDAPSHIEGSAGEFCRVAARRLSPGQTGLQARGPYGSAALAVLRTYAA